MTNTISLGSELDKLIIKLIDKEVNARLNGPPKGYWNTNLRWKDQRLISSLEDKELTVQSLKEQMHSLFNEVFIEFLKEKCGASHFTFEDSKKILCCLFHQSSQNPKVAMFTKTIYKDKIKITTLTVLVQDVREGLNKNINLKQFTIYPALEDKIERIADFIIKQTSFKHMIEATRGMRYKTPAERTHDNFIEWDTYGLTKYYGQAYGNELKWQEEHIRDDFELREYKSKVVMEISK